MLYRELYCRKQVEGVVADKQFTRHCLLTAMAELHASYTRSPQPIRHGREHGCGCVNRPAHCSVHCKIIIQQSKADECGGVTAIGRRHRGIRYYHKRYLVLEFSFEWNSKPVLALELLILPPYSTAFIVPIKTRGCVWKWRDNRREWQIAGCCGWPFPRLSVWYIMWRHKVSYKKSSVLGLVPSKRVSVCGYTCNNFEVSWSF